MTGAEFEGVDIDLLADYVGGALDGTPDQERVAALVATDTSWRAAYEALEPGMIAVGAVLRELEPEPMPGDLAAQLDALFRTRPAEEQPAEPVHAKVVDLDRARRRRRWAAPIAVAAATVAFAGVGLTSFLQSDSMDAAQSTAGAAANSQAEAATDTAAVDSVTTRSGTDYTSGSLASAAGKQTRSSASLDSPAPAVGQEPLSVFSLDRLSSPDALADCLDAISRENGGLFTVELVDYARFQGAPAVIVRFAAANGTWVWAVGPECGATGAGANLLEQVPVR